ncbi:MAG: N-acetylglucosamine/diacetylchitobiose ABC transporter substrate-binding protein, partial [Propionibacteriales bacterium]|nr:N-acetylglucosamine/diacetylchitobiose ABC transporter substrate-binding protein [Propionibacteriales bacterium]
WGGGATVRAVPDIQMTLQPRLDAGDPPDLIDNSGAGAMAVGPLVTGGKLADLKPLLDAPSVDDPSRTISDVLRPGVAESGTYEGVVRHIGYAFSLWGFWFSRSWFDERGWSPSRTWDEFLSLSDEIATKGKRAPYVHPGARGDYQATVVLSQAVKHGGLGIARDIDNLAPEAWTNVSVMRAAQEWQQYVAEGFVLAGAEGMDTAAAQQAWLDGRAAVLPCGTWLENEMRGKVPPAFDMVVAPFPSLSTADELPWTAVHGGSTETFLVPAEAANAPGGMEFLRQMLSKAGVDRFTETTGSLVAVKDAELDLRSPSSALKSVAEVSAAAGEDVFELRYASWYAPLHAKVQEMISKLMAGQATADEFCATMQQATDQVLADPEIKKFKR